ncbi:MAG: hypothetical protein ABR585_13560 [Gemmatimonadaceae bacterium]|nr:hypothetical protein [Actinomycetota bacterium]
MPDSEDLDYWKKPQGQPVRCGDWIDPDPSATGMLAADRIEYYVQQVGMISPFNRAMLKPASYGMTLGPFYQVDGVHKVLTPLEVLVIPKNSIVFVSMREALRIPHYIVARFNLSIDLIYKGLLLGTGPQVDPGFQGVLSCPLHNISNQPIRIKLGDHFATIDFAKTTPLAERSLPLLESLTSEEELYDREADLIGHEGYNNRLFSQKKRWARPILDYSAGERKVASSVASLQKKVRQVTKLNYAVLIGALGLTVAVITLVLSLYQDLRGQIVESRQEIDRLRRNVSSQVTTSPTSVPTSPVTSVPAPTVPTSR